MRLFSTNASLKTKPPTQVNKKRLFLIWLGLFFPPRKWVFIYSHQRAIGAFQQRWWQDIKQIVCNEVIIKHNPVVSHTDLSLWQKTTNTRTATHHSQAIYRHETHPHTHAHSYDMPPHVFLYIIIKGEECTVYFSVSHHECVFQTVHIQQFSSLIVRLW